MIAFPGRNGPQAQTRMLVRHGYGVLLFDRRGSGESEGDPHGFGWEGEKDIKAAIAFLKRQPDVDPGAVGGLGLSVGGELMLHAAAETDDLAAVVSEGAGSRSVGEVSEMPGIGLPMQVVETMITAGNTLFSNSPPPPLMQDIIGRIAPRPVFIIWTRNGVDTEALNPHVLRGGWRAQDAVGDPRVQARRRPAGATSGVRAARRRLLRRRAASMSRRTRPRVAAGVAGGSRRPRPGNASGRAGSRRCR